jgi:hypothetical protein
MSPDEILDRCIPHRIVTPFVRRYGRLFEARNLPKPFRRGPIGACYANSYRMAVRTGLTYVEGYALGHHGSAQLHAWCVDDDGGVFDRTWVDALAYLGVAFRTSYLKEVIGRRRRRHNLYYGLLDDWRARWPLEKELSDSPHIWSA